MRGTVDTVRFYGRADGFYGAFIARWDLVCGGDCGDDFIHRDAIR